MMNNDINGETHRAANRPLSGPSSKTGGPWGPSQIADIDSPHRSHKPLRDKVKGEGGSLTQREHTP
jgi:hypothetical protein